MRPPGTEALANGRICRISIIVPALNEAEHLPATLSSLTLSPGDELIVVDGGSSDATVALARQYTPHVLRSPAGRALQMNRGASQARGEVLLFLHADTRLPGGGLERVRTAMQSPRVVGGAFCLAFTPSSPAMRVIAWGVNMRSRFGKLPFGDQALFVRRSVFEALGGYAVLPFMEDVWLVRALRQHGTLALLPEAVQTSSRRWQRRGLIATTLWNNLLLMLYWCGVSPATLKRWYQ